MILLIRDARVEVLHKDKKMIVDSIIVGKPSHPGIKKQIKQYLRYFR